MESIWFLFEFFFFPVLFGVGKLSPRAWGPVTELHPEHPPGGKEEANVPESCQGQPLTPGTPALLGRARA